MFGGVGAVTDVSHGDAIAGSVASCRGIRKATLPIVDEALTHRSGWATLGHRLVRAIDAVPGFSSSLGPGAFLLTRKRDFGQHRGMKTIALALSVLSLLSISAIAEDLADFISQEKTYTVHLSDRRVFYGVEFRKWRSGTDWAHISYSHVPSRSTGESWINFTQVTSIKEEEAKRAEDSTDAARDDAEAKDETKNSEPHIEVNESSEAVSESVDQPEDSAENRIGELEGAALGGVAGGEAGAGFGAIAVDVALVDPSESPEIIERLEAITSIRKRIVEHQKSLFAEGRASQLDIAESQIAFLESQIELAESKRESDEVVKLLRHLVEIQRGRVKVAEKQFAAGRSDETQIAEAEIAFLKAEIRLLGLEE